MLPRATNTRMRREAAEGRQSGARRRSSGSSAAACAP
jgi:ribonuclease PH